MVLLVSGERIASHQFDISLHHILDELRERYPRRPVQLLLCLRRVAEELLLYRVNEPTED